jgi:ubiquinone/menaquinone biosynthesis C-methylase UbiE
MTLKPPNVPTFANVDQSAADLRAAVLVLLDRLASLPAIRRVRQIARAALDVRAGQRLLDAGCGAGEEARDLARLVGPDGKVTAIDVSDTLIATARERDNGIGVHYAVGDVTALAFPDDTFDSLRSERVIQHVADPDAAIAELVRVVRASGRVCLVDTDWESFLADGIPEDLCDMLEEATRKLDMRKPTGRLLRGRLIRAGLEDVTAEPVTITLTDRATAETIHPIFNPQAVRLMGLLSEELTGTWFTALDEAIARGDFLGVLTMWVVTGVKKP